MKLIIEFNIPGMVVTYEHIEWKDLNNILSLYEKEEFIKQINRIIIIGVNENEE